MAHKTALQSFSATAGADLSALQYTFVGLNADGEVVAPSAAGVLAVGILQNAPLAGEAANVAHGGESKCVFGATVANGASVATNATGRAVVATGIGTYINGIVSLGAADGEIGSVVLKPAGPLAA